MKKTILIGIVIILALLVIINILGLWRGRGTIIDFVQGQFPAKPTELDSGASMNKDATVIDVSITIDLDMPIN